MTFTFTVALLPHPDTPETAPRVTVHGARKTGRLQLCYHIQCARDTFVWYEAAAPEPERLWAHGCCEIFIRAAGERAYREYNFAPSGDWASYAFADTRVPDANALAAPPPALDWQYTDKAVTLDVLLPLREADHTPLALALSVVLECSDARLVHCALAHPPGAPDFHHDLNFALALPAFFSQSFSATDFPHAHPFRPRPPARG
ncbi:MAG: hypothetical protein LBR88_01375 [Zoogloeaceae bacterium]|jgi:hypothetical protein|nr:hypothetical protein [Zoogloeaceae bacterium]